MLRSLYTGVVGLKTHQTKMDVIGNNIANVNTVAFKSDAVSFKSLLYQNVQEAKGANAATGVAATNAKQIGLGTAIGAITSSITTSGATQNTGNPLDLRINGESFFIVNDGQRNLFTKAGNFYVDGAGNLAMTSNGFNVMGWQPNAEGNDVIKGVVSPLRIMRKENLTLAAQATTNSTVTGVLDMNSPNLYTKAGQVLGISFYDENGNPYHANLAITADENSKTTGTYTVTIDSVVNSTTGKEMNLGARTSATINYSLQTGEYQGGLIHMFIDAENALDEDADPNAKGNEPFALPGGIDIDLTKTFVYNNNGLTTLKATPGDADGLGAGRRVGNLKGFSVQVDGKIYGSYDNGGQRLLGQISVANFTNPMGLEKVGDNLYVPSLNSGVFNGVGVDITEGGGSMSAGVLEMSNVDLSNEFTEMITTQRGFQVNSRVITVSDQMLQTLEELKR